MRWRLPGRGIRPEFAEYATLSRAARLLDDFRFEQTDPARFYGAIAADTAQMVGDWHDRPLRDAVILDVGGGPGYFADAFDRRGKLDVILDLRQ